MAFLGGVFEQQGCDETALRVRLCTRLVPRAAAEVPSNLHWPRSSGIFRGLSVKPGCALFSGIGFASTSPVLSEILGREEETAKAVRNSVTEVWSVLAEAIGVDSVALESGATHGLAPEIGGSSYRRCGALEKLERSKE